MLLKIFNKYTKERNALSVEKETDKIIFYQNYYINKIIIQITHVQVLAEN